MWVVEATSHATRRRVVRRRRRQLRRSTSAGSGWDITAGAAPFDTTLVKYGLLDPVLTRIGQIVHEADLEDERFDAPEAPGLEVVLPGLSMVLDDHDVLAVTQPVFDGLYAFLRRELLLHEGRA